MMDEDQIGQLLGAVQNFNPGADGVMDPASATTDGPMPPVGGGPVSAPPMMPPVPIGGINGKPLPGRKLQMPPNAKSLIQRWQG